MTWRGEPDGITGTSNVTYVCPPDAYQHEPNAPAHRHHDRCQRIEPFVDEEPAAAQIARLKAEVAREKDAHAFAVKVHAAEVWRLEARIRQLEAKC